MNLTLRFQHLNMEAIILFAFFLTAVLIPIALLVVSGTNYAAKIELKEIILKLLLSLLAYFPITLIIFWYMASLRNAMAHANGNALDAKSETIHFLTVLAYGFFGLVFCKFVKGGFKDTFSIFRRDWENNQTIFGAK